MSKKRSIVIISIIIVISLIISIYIPNKEKIEETENTTINYSTIESDNKIGVTDGVNMIIEPQYDEIIIPNSHRAVFMCQNGENKKFVNQNNEEIFQEYDNVELVEINDSNYEKNILIYENDGKLGLLGLTGKTITDAKYEEIYNLGLKEGEVVVKKNNKYGILDEKGNQKIKNEYDLIQSDEYYSEENGYKKSGYIVRQTTSEGYRYGYYDSEGVQVLAEEYNQLSRITQIQSNDIYLIAAKNGQFGVFINNSKIINTQYQEIDYNSDLEVFIVERTGKFGAIKLNGTEILKPEFSELQINGIYIYTLKEGEKQVWDTTGNEVNISFETVIQKANSEYYIKNDAGKYSILDANLKSITKQNYKYLEYAYNDCFIATNEQDKTGIIDLQENIITHFNYDVIQVLKGKNVVQAIDFATNFTTFLDKDFDLITEIMNAEIEYLDEGFRIYNNEMTDGIILDNNGKLITD